MAGPTEAASLRALAKAHFEEAQSDYDPDADDISLPPMQVFSLALPWKRCFFLFAPLFRKGFI
jgi:hypothetical protein